MIPDLTCAYTNKEFKVTEPDQTEILIPEGTPIFVESYDNGHNYYRAAVKIGEKYVKIGDPPEDLDIVVFKSLDKDVRDMFIELSKHC